MVCCALIADAFVGNMQEKLMKSHSLSQASLVTILYYHTVTLAVRTITFGHTFVLDLSHVYAWIHSNFNPYNINWGTFRCFKV